MALLRKQNPKPSKKKQPTLNESLGTQSLEEVRHELDNMLLVAQQLGLGYLTYSYKTKTFQVSTSLNQLLNTAFHKEVQSVDEFMNLLHPDSKSVMEGFLSEPKTSKKQLSSTLKLILANAEVKESLLLEISGQYTGSSDDLTLFATLRNITKEHRHTKELQKSLEKAQNSDHIKTNFLLNISHNIRTPMNSILGFAELLSISDPGPERRKEYIQIIKKQSKSLLQLIDDVAEIAKFENGLVNISKSPVNINLLLNEVIKDLENLRAASRREHVHIAIQVPDKEGIEVFTDGGRLHQIFINLANHALKNTTDGIIKIGYHAPEDNRVNFFITDTSPGLNKDELKGLFDRFLIVGEEDSKRYSDESNLGLGIAKSIVKLLGGKISAESEEGEGLTINFSIPYEQQPKETPAVIEDDNFGSQYNWSDKVVLIVEDEDVNGMFLEAVFQDTGAQTIFAKNGRQAVDLCESINKIDLILMDIRMPVMNGILATKEIRKNNHVVPIIAQTAMAHVEDRENCLLAGCNDYVTKPIEVEELLQMVNQYLAI